MPSSAKPNERSRLTLPSVADIGILPRDAVARRLNRDPFGRFHRTANTSLDAVFGNTARARRALRRIDARHVAVRGTAADGRRYRAQDPELLLWVQATLVLTSL